MRNLVIVRKTIILFSIINIVVIVYSVIMRIQNVNQKSELGLFFWYKIIFCLLLCGYMIFEAVIINIVVIVYSVIMRIQNVNQKSELGLFFWYKIIFCLLLCGYMIFEAVVQKKLYETVGLCGYCKFVWVLWIFGLVVFLVSAPLFYSEIYVWKSTSFGSAAGYLGAMIIFNVAENLLKKIISAHKG